MTDKVTKLAFAVSFLGHCIFLGMPGFNINISQIDKPEDIVVKIEIEKPLLLPRIDTLGEEKKLKEVVEEPEHPEPEPELKPEEIAVEEPVKEPVRENIEVADPAQEAMLRYQDMVKQRIEEARRYPSWAEKQGIEGITYLYFTVLPGGAARDIRIIRTSGSNILDQEAAATVKRASPFPPLPEEIGSTPVNMEVAIVFALSD